MTGSLLIRRSGVGKTVVSNAQTGDVHFLLTTYTLPGDEDFPMHVTSIEISPDPPKPGEELTVTAVGETTERVEASHSTPSTPITSFNLSCRRVHMPMLLSRLVGSRSFKRRSTFAKRREFNIPCHLTSIYLSRIRRNANVSIQCPVKAGVYKVVQTVALPKEIPPGEGSGLD